MTVRELKKRLDDLTSSTNPGGPVSEDAEVKTVGSYEEGDERVTYTINRVYAKGTPATQRQIFIFSL